MIILKSQDGNLLTHAVTVEYDHNKAFYKQYVIYTFDMSCSRFEVARYSNETRAKQALKDIEDAIEGDERIFQLPPDEPLYKTVNWEKLKDFIEANKDRIYTVRVGIDDFLTTVYEDGEYKRICHISFCYRYHSPEIFVEYLDETDDFLDEEDFVIGTDEDTRGTPEWWGCSPANE